MINPETERSLDAKKKRVTQLLGYLEDHHLAVEVTCNMYWFIDIFCMSLPLSSIQKLSKILVSQLQFSVWVEFT